MSVLVEAPGVPTLTSMPVSRGSWLRQRSWDLWVMGVPAAALFVLGEFVTVALFWACVHWDTGVGTGPPLWLTSLAAAFVLAGPAALLTMWLIVRRSEPSHHERVAAVEWTLASSGLVLLLAAGGLLLLVANLTNDLS